MAFKINLNLTNDSVPKPEPKPVALTEKQKQRYQEKQDKLLGINVDDETKPEPKPVALTEKEKQRYQEKQDKLLGINVDEETSIKVDFKYDVGFDIQKNVFDRKTDRLLGITPNERIEYEVSSGRFKNEDGSINYTELDNYFRYNSDIDKNYALDLLGINTGMMASGSANDNFKRDFNSGKFRNEDGSINYIEMDNYLKYHPGVDNTYVLNLLKNDSRNRTKTDILLGITGAEVIGKSANDIFIDDFNSGRFIYEDGGIKQREMDAYLKYHPDVTCADYVISYYKENCMVDINLKSQVIAALNATEEEKNNNAFYTNGKLDEAKIVSFRAKYPHLSDFLNDLLVKCRFRDLLYADPKKDPLGFSRLHDESGMLDNGKIAKYINNFEITQNDAALVIAEYCQNRDLLIQQHETTVVERQNKSKNNLDKYYNIKKTLEDTAYNFIWGYGASYEEDGLIRRTDVGCFYTPDDIRTYYLELYGASWEGYDPEIQDKINRAVEEYTKKFNDAFKKSTGMTWDQYKSRLDFVNASINREEKNIYDYKNLEKNIPYLKLANSEEYNNWLINGKNSGDIIEVKYNNKGNYGFEYVFYVNGVETNPSEINPILLSEKVNNVNLIVDNNAVDSVKYMTEDQKNMFNYLWLTQGKNAAYTYLGAIEDSINQAKGREKANIFLDSLKDDAGSLVLNPANYAKVLAKGVGDGVVTFSEGLQNIFSGNGVMSASQYEQSFILSSLQNSAYLYLESIAISKKDSLSNLNVDDFLKKCMNSDGSINLEYARRYLNDEEYNHLVKLVEFDNSVINNFYEFGSSFGNMVPSMVVSTLSNIAIPGSGAIIGSALMGMSSAGNAYNGALISGHDKVESFVYGVLSGASESVVGYLLGNIPGLNPSATLSIRGILSEGVEEFVQTFVDAGLRAMVLGEEIDVASLGPEALKSFIYGVLMSGITNTSVLAGRTALNIKYEGKLVNFKKFGDVVNFLSMMNNPDIKISSKDDRKIFTVSSDVDMGNLINDVGNFFPGAVVIQMDSSGKYISSIVDTNLLDADSTSLTVDSSMIEFTVKSGIITQEQFLSLVYKAINSGDTNSPYVQQFLSLVYKAINSGDKNSPYVQAFNNMQFGNVDDKKIRYLMELDKNSKLPDAEDFVHNKMLERLKDSFGKYLSDSKINSLSNQIYFMSRDVFNGIFKTYAMGLSIPSSNYFGLPGGNYVDLNYPLYIVKSNCVHESIHTLSRSSKGFGFVYNDGQNFFFRGFNEVATEWLTKFVMGDEYPTEITGKLYCGYQKGVYMLDRLVYSGILDADKLASSYFSNDISYVEKAISGISDLNTYKWLMYYFDLAINSKESAVQENAYLHIERIISDIIWKNRPKDWRNLS